MADNISSLCFIIGFHNHFKIFILIFKIIPIFWALFHQIFSQKYAIHLSKQLKLLFQVLFLIHFRHWLNYYANLILSVILKIYLYHLSSIQSKMLELYIEISKVIKIQVNSNANFRLSFELAQKYNLKKLKNVEKGLKNEYQ